MHKNQKDILCAICGNKIDPNAKLDGEKCSREHAIPKSWFPDLPSKNVRWIVPTHKKCNSDFSADEAHVLHRLVTAIDPFSHAATGLWKRTLRSIQPEEGRNPADSNARQRNRDKLKQSMIPISKATPETTKGALSAATNNSPAEHLMVLDASKKDRVLLKIIRCCYYKLYGEPVPSNAQVNASFVHQDDISDFYDKLGQHYSWTKIGAYVNVGHIRINNASNSSVGIAIVLWDAIFISGYVITRI